MEAEDFAPLSGETQMVSVKSILSTCIDNPASINQYLVEEEFGVEKIVGETISYLSLASNASEVKRIVAWLVSVFGAEEARDAIIKTVSSQKIDKLSSRSARILVNILHEIKALNSVSLIESLFSRMSIQETEHLPSPTGIDMVVSGEPTLAKFLIASYFKCPLPAGFVSKWLGDFKGTSEELAEALSVIKGCKFDRESDASLKSVVERMLLRSSLNACLVIGSLAILPLVADQFVPLLSAETDNVRLAALATLKMNSVDEAIQKKLITAFNGKGVAVKVRATLAEAISLGPQTEEAKALARTTVVKEANESIVGFLLDLVSNESACYAAFKTAKPSMRTVLVQKMNGQVLAEHAKTIFDLVGKETTPASPESARFACAALSKLSTTAAGMDWGNFLAEADSKPAALLRQSLNYAEDSQCDIIDWLLSLTATANPTASKYVTLLGLSGHANARRHLNIKLSTAPKHNLDLAVVSQNLDGSANAWKLCKSLVKAEADAVALFGVCHVHGLNWIVLASKVCKNIPALLESNFEKLWSPLNTCPAALKTLVDFAPTSYHKHARSFIEETLGSIESSDFATEQQIWSHSDHSTPAAPLKKATGTAKPDPKAEKALLEKQLAEEKATRATICERLVGLKACIPVAKLADCEDLGMRASRLLSWPIYQKEASQLLYALGRAWRPLVATSLLRHALGDGSELIDRDWNIPSLSSMEDSIKRLFNQTKPLEPAVLYTIPILIVWLSNGQYDFIRPFADRLQDLTVINDLTMIKGERFDLVKALLAFENRTPDVDRIMTIVGEGMEMTEGEAAVFLAALYSETLTLRRTALEALHTSWSVPAALSKPFKLVIDLLKNDDACMQVATVVSLKLAEAFPRNSQDGGLEVRELCHLFESKPSDSWVIEAAKECIAGMENGEVSMGILLERYDALLKERRPEVVNVRSKDLDLTRDARWAVVESLGMLSIPTEPTVRLMEKIVLDLFFDPAESCYEAALQSSLALLEAIPAERMEACGPQLGSLFEGFLSGKIKSQVEHTVAEADRARVFVIILLGRVSRYMAQDAQSRHGLVRTMVETLKTPSESVQGAVAEALIPLFSSPAHRQEASGWVGQLKTEMLTGQSMAVRRGAAYGLAALAKARGLVAVREWDLMACLLDPLRPSIPKGQPKPSTESKEGALFGLELLAKFYGRAFEPYVMHTIDHILGGFSDGKAEVREATLEAARSLMGCISSAGARLLLPELLGRAAGSEEGGNWRSKVGVLEWLGAMASMAPSVLAARLPQIIPVLIEGGLNDSHGQVQAAARSALLHYGKAAGNPEMRSLVPSILEALADPATAIVPCFRRILDTKFYHVIDGPSLALLEPLLRRALVDRSSGAASLKKLSGQIIGNLATSLVDAADFGPYLGSLIPALCGCLGDPVPQVRTHAAKVLGMLVRVAEVDGRPGSLEAVGDLVPSLESRLLSSGEIDKAGAAQALAEIMAAKGIAYTASVLADRLAGYLASPTTGWREGGLLVLGYLPAAFTFYDRLPELYAETPIPSLLSACLDLAADQVESVRVTAGKTAKSLVEQFIGAGIDRPGVFAMLLDGFGSPKWRVRMACLGLLEKALTTYDDDAQGDEDGGDLPDGMVKVARLPSSEELVESGILQVSSVKLLQARLFIARFDPSSSQLRNSALNLWKALSQHTRGPRALAEILPVLVREVAGPASLMPEASEQVELALDDMFVKLADRLALPFLTEALALYTEDADGICRGAVLSAVRVLVNVLGTSSDSLTRNALEEATRRIVDLTILGLSDTSEDDDTTRIQAARLFDALLTRLLPSPDLSTPVIRHIVQSVGYGDALILLIESQPTAVLSVIIPALLAQLSSSSSSEALEQLERVFEAAGHAAVHHAIPVLKALLSTGMDGMEDCISAVLSSLNQSSSYDSDDSEDDNSSQDTVYHLRLGQLMEAQVEAGRPHAAHLIIRLYCQLAPSMDHGRWYALWLPRLFTATLTITTGEQDEAKQALLALIASPRPHNLPAIVQALRAPVSRAERQVITLSSWHTPILTQLTKACLLPIITAAASTSNADMEAVKCYACEVASGLLKISASSPAAASWGTSALTLLIGALIRLGSDRKATDSRPAAFATISDALSIHPAALRPFFPQLQRLLAQVITTPTEDCLAPATRALSILLPLLPKPEALLHDWAAILAVSEDGDVADDNIQRVSPPAKAAMLKAMSAILTSSPTIIGPKLASFKEPLLQLIKLLAAHEDEAVRHENARFIEAMALAQVISPSERQALMDLATMLK